MRTSFSRCLRLTLATSLLLAGALSSTPAMAIEEPRYRQIQADGECSLREYASVIVAETYVEGGLDEASSAGFRRLAGYIFGANHTSSGDSKKVAMTAPVATTKTKIAMTAPVSTHQHGVGWTVNFTMPAQYTLESLPLPDDDRVTLRQVPTMMVAVIRFSGTVNESKIESKTSLLRNWMAAHALAADGDARLARYNPPWTLPFLRRNEILIPCSRASATR